MEFRYSLLAGTDQAITNINVKGIFVSSKL
jgi:hypothetical protein